MKRMTVNEAIALAKSVRDSDCDNELYIRWLNTIEGRIQVEILGIMPGDEAYVYYGENDGDRELIVSLPYDDIYIYYLAALSDYHVKEYDAYANDAAIFDKAFNDFREHYRLVNGCKSCGQIVGYENS